MSVTFKPVTLAPIFSFILILAAVMGITSSAQAETGHFELGLSAGYNYGMALNPVDGNDTPKAVVDGNGFAATIYAGAKVSKYIGIYADFGLNLSYVNDAGTVENTIMRKDDYLYVFSALLALRFFQSVYKGEIFETFAMGYGFAGDSFIGEDPKSGFVTKVSLGYLINATQHFQIGIVANVLVNHKLEKDYFNLSVGAELQTVYHF